MCAMTDTSSESFQTPVLFLIYNRPELTKQVFEAIKKVRPSKLFIAADGPKPQYADQADRCNLTRQIATQVDWECDVKTLFRDQNLGCGKAVSRAITWFFDHVTEGIILEDDCLPTPDFFRFCSDLLQRYRFDNRVMEIGGNSFCPVQEADNSYSFSNHNMIWGWATWRRAWNLYDFEMSYYPQLKQTGALKTLFKFYEEAEWLTQAFERSYNNNNLTWDYQWEFSRRINSGLTIVPSKNLVRNIGLGIDATHTFDPNGPGSKLKAESMSFPLVHPDYVMVDESTERRFFFKNFTTFRSRVKSNIRKILSTEYGRPLSRYTLSRT